MRMKREVMLLALALSLYSISGSADPPVLEQPPDTPSDIEEVLARLEEKVSALETLRADFIQEKRLSVLDRPLVLKGTIFVQKPDLFAWHVTEPLRYSLVIRDEMVREWNEDTNQLEEVSLSENPAFRMAIGQMRGWLSGAYRSMLGDYEVTVVEEDPISLEFIPRKTAFAREVIDSLTVVFESDERYIRRIRIMERNGDSTLLTFVDTLLDSPIDPSAWKAERRVR
jgi:outer membrane lipoprotein-sorting protein